MKLVNNNEVAKTNTHVPDFFFFFYTRQFSEEKGFSLRGLRDIENKNTFRQESNPRFMGYEASSLPELFDLLMTGHKISVYRVTFIILFATQSTIRTCPQMTDC